MHTRSRDHMVNVSAVGFSWLKTKLVTVEQELEATQESLSIAEETIRNLGLVGEDLQTTIDELQVTLGQQQELNKQLAGIIMHNATLLGVAALPQDWVPEMARLNPEINWIAEPTL